MRMRRIDPKHKNQVEQRLKWPIHEDLSHVAPWLRALRAARWLSDLRAPSTVATISRPAIRKDVRWESEGHAAPNPGEYLVVAGLQVTAMYGGFYSWFGAGCLVETSCFAHESMPLVRVPPRMDYFVNIEPWNEEGAGLVLLYGWKIDEQEHLDLLRVLRREP